MNETRWMTRAVGFILLLVAIDGLTASGAAPAARKPNVLFILTDDQGRQTLGCYGGTKLATPNLDALARDGMRFDEAYVMPQCTPTRASLFTGQHTARNGMWHVIGWYGYPWARVSEPAFVEQMSRSTFTLPKALRAGGYATGMAGKWHLTNGPDGTYGNLNAAAADAYGFDYVSPPSTKEQAALDKGVDHLTDEAIGFIERNRERPWFFYLAHHTVHHLLAAPPKLIQEFHDAGAPEEGHHNALYLACLKHLDDSVGRLLAKLDELKLRDDTLVVFLSDNGGIDFNFDQQDFTRGAGGNLKKLRLGREEFDNAPFRFGKGSPYEGGIRVPCLVRWPGVVKAGAVCATPVHVIDWLPTLIEVSGGLPPPQGHAVDGVSLVPLLQGKTIAPRPLYWYLPLYDLRWGATPCAVVRDGPWKLIDYFGDSFDADGNYREGARAELFRLDNDPGEAVDLAEQEPQRVAALQKQLRDWMTSIPATIPQANPHYDANRSFVETKEKQPWNPPSPAAAEKP